MRAIGAEARSAFGAAGNPAASIAWLALCAVALVAGYSRGVSEERGDLVLPADVIVGVTAFEDFRTFSEVGTARGHIRALAHRALYEFRLRNLPALTGDPGPVAGGCRPGLQEALRDLTELTEEFRETGGEAILLAELLRILKREGLHERWLLHFLEYSRRRPASELSTSLIREAACLAETRQGGPESLSPGARSVRYSNAIGFQRDP